MVKKIRRPEGTVSSLPIGMDSVIKRYFNKYRDKGVLPPFLEGLIQGKLARIPLGLSYSIPEADLIINGRLDECIELADKIYVPLDHKTRGSLPADEKYSYTYYQNQMSTYSLLLREYGLKIRNEAYIVYYAPDKENIQELHNGFSFKIVVHQIKTNPDRVLALYVKARQCINRPIPAPNSECEFCNWAKKVIKVR
jgi:hypothetical protein